MGDLNVKLDKLNQNSLEEMYRDTLALWNDADNKNMVRLAEYYDDLLNEIELRMDPLMIDPVEDFA